MRRSSVERATSQKPAERDGVCPSDEGCYVISVAADLVRLHPQTLRRYERLGLLEPARTDGNVRRYSERDIARLRRIQQLMDDLGVNLAGVEVIMTMHDHLETQRAEFEQELQEQRETYEAEIRRLRAALERVQREREL